MFRQNFEFKRISISNSDQLSISSSATYLRLQPLALSLSSRSRRLISSLLPAKKWSSPAVPNDTNAAATELRTTSARRVPTLTSTL